MYLVPLVPQAILDGVLLTEGKKPTGLVQGLVTLMGGRTWLSQHLWLPTLVIVVVALLAGAFTYLRGRWAAFASETIIRRLRDRVYAHLHTLPSSYYDKVETGDLIQRCTSDVETLRLFLSSQVTEIGRALIMLLVPLPLMYMISPAMTLASVVLLPFIVAFSLIFFARIKERFQEADEAEAQMTATLQENLTGIRVVRAFSRQAFECEKFEQKNSKHRQSDYRLYDLLANFWAISDLLCLSQQTLVVFVGLVMLGQGTLGVGALYFFLAAVNMFLWPVRRMGRIMSDMGQAVVALGRLNEVLQVPGEENPEEEVIAASMPAFASAHAGAISFEGVSFAYGDTPVLKDISFSIEPGQTLALVGPSGSGKSTLIRLLLRLYDPTKGTIRAGGVDVQTLPRKRLRERMASTMQSVFLYSKRLDENIKMGRTEATEEEMIEATRLAAVHDSICSFEGGYATLLGERGVTLSGGQRQRVALARALLQEADVLILDDSMSAVDTETEKTILAGLAKRQKRQTTVIAAHRLSAVMNADLILVLQAGEVVESGNHEALLAQGGWYKELWEAQHQFDEIEEEAQGASLRPRMHAA